MNFILRCVVFGIILSVVALCLGLDYDWRMAIFTVVALIGSDLVDSIYKA